VAGPARMVKRIVGPFGAECCKVSAVPGQDGEIREMARVTRMICGDVQIALILVCCLRRHHGPPFSLVREPASACSAS